MSTLLDNLRVQWDETANSMTAITDSAAQANRDMNDVERSNFTALTAQLDDLKPRIEQLVEVERSLEATAGLFGSVEDGNRQELQRSEGPAMLAATYGSAGDYLYDALRAYGPGADLDARSRITRATTINGATVQDVTLADLVGVVPEPIIGPIWSAIDARRRVVGTLVNRAITAALMFRPKVVQHTNVDKQGVAGKLGSIKTNAATTDEKKAFVSREMKLARVDIEPIAMGGVVDVSLWAEMLSPGLLDMIVSDLADEYAIQSEANACAEVERAAIVSKLTTVALGPDTINAQIFTAAAKVYGATGRMPSDIGMAVDTWAKIGGMVDGNKRPLFPVIGPNNANAQMPADSFSGGMTGLRMTVSPGFSNGMLNVYAGDSIEFFERRLGVLQVIEPERAGRVVSYSGLVTTVAMDDGAAVQIVYT